MAVDLKSVLSQVLSSHGKKDFFFAYGAGKRKDGKGDGEFVVRDKKVAKPEIVAKLADCKEFCEGVCRSGDGPKDGQTIYFEGKGAKLSKQIVAKMKLCAKALTGKQYEFQLPPTEEKEGEDETETLDAASSSAEGEASEEESSEDAKGKSDEHKDLYLGLRSTLLPDLLQLKKRDAAAAARIEPIVIAAAGHEKKGDYQKAYTFLDQGAKALAKALGAGRANEAKDVIPEGKVAEVKAALEQAQTRWNSALTNARARFKPVQAAMQKDFPAAAAGMKNILDGYEKELLSVLKAGQAKADREGLAVAVRTTLAKVKSLRAEVAKDEVFTYLEECGVAVKGTFAESFDAVENLLQN